MKTIILSLTICTTAACIKVPAEVVAASHAVNDGLGQSRQMTLQWIEATYGEARTRLEAQLHREWYPQYQAEMIRALTPEERDQLSRGLQSGQPEPILQEWHHALTGEYLNRQQALQNELDEAQQTVVNGVNQWYDDLQALQGAVSGYLESAREISITRQKLLSGLDVLRGADPKLDRALDLTRAIETLLQNPAEPMDLRDLLENRIKGEPK